MSKRRQDAGDTRRPQPVQHPGSGESPRPAHKGTLRRLAYVAPAIVSSFFITPASAAPQSGCNPNGGPCMPTQTPCTPNG